MGKSFWLLFILIVISLGIYGVSFYQENLWGLGPTLKNPSGDIAKLILDATKIPKNITGMPLKLPKGFAVSIFAKSLGDPRVMVFDSGGTLLVSLPQAGKVVALPDKNEDGVADGVVTILEGLNKPHGLALYNNAFESNNLYVAEEDKIVSYRYDRESLKASNPKKILDIPKGGNHTTRSIMFLPVPNDNKLLVSIGSTCNVCHEKDKNRAVILETDVEGKSVETYATGLRNSVFMALHPVTGQVWATEMGRDLLGDDLPPDEINIIERGKNYGWPSCYGKNVHDTNFDKNVYIRNPCTESYEIPSYIDIPAHSAPLGLAFVPPEDVPEKGWPREYWNNLLVAYHGSWNRNTPTGYKVVRHKFDAKGNYLDVEDFITGWLVPSENGINKFIGQAPEAVLGRPAGILVLGGGTIYISDDKAGVIYRVVYRGDLVSEETATTTEMTQYSDLLQVDSPKPNALVQNPLAIEGRARGSWFFEASFPVLLKDAAGGVIAQGRAEALGDWMTPNFIPFRARLNFSKPAIAHGVLILKKDNPSGLTKNEKLIEVPVRFR